MATKISVSKLMTPNVIVANTKTKFSDIIDFFDLYKLQHLPVAEDDKLIGILSINDIMRYISAKLKAGSAMSLASLSNTFDITEVMTTNPVSVHPNDSFSDVVKILAEGNFQSVPVVENGLIVGIVTNKDVVRIYHSEF